MNDLWKQTLNARASKRLKPRKLEVLACYRAYAADGIMSPSGVDITAVCGIHATEVARFGKTLVRDGLLTEQGNRRRYPDDPAVCARIDAMIAAA